MIIQFIFLNLILFAHSYAMKQSIILAEDRNTFNNQKAFDALKMINAKELYGSTLALTKRPIARESEMWKCELNHDHKDGGCIKTHPRNIKSGDYIAALLGVLSQSCTFNNEKIEVKDFNAIKNFIVTQPGIQEEVANKIVRDQLLKRKKIMSEKERWWRNIFKKASELKYSYLLNKKLPECIEESLQSAEADENDPKLCFINTSPIEEFFIGRYSDEIQEKCKELIKEKKGIYNIVDDVQYKDKSKSFFARIIGFFSWWKK